MLASRKLSPLGRAVLVSVTYPLPTLLVVFIDKALKHLPFWLSSALVCLFTSTMILAYLYIFDKKPLSVLRLGLNWPAIKGFILSFVLTAILVCFGYALSLFFSTVYYEQAKTLTIQRLWSAFIPSFIVQGFPEELAFRSYIGQTLKQSRMHRLFWSAGLFSLIHAVHIFTGDWRFGLETVFYAFSFGALAFVLQELFQTTWAAVAVHGGLHFTRFIWEFKGIYPEYIYFYCGALMLLVSAGIIYRYRGLFIDKDINMKTQ